MSPMTRRLVYVTLYELIAVLMTTGALAAVGHDPHEAGLFAVLASAVALTWNLAYTSAFEWWEARQVKRGRSLARRVAHAIGFEAGLVIVLVPLLAWSVGVTLLEALVLDAGLIVFFLVYTFVFNLAFDRVFGLPASARAEAGC
ncbi:hypothetical protein GCM10007276_33210 [Agaricicola taiwanensis]|uniref:Chlorhexidine efflux transporter domain-containing protein n=1 Tax=Agaricicola taiwanensis TaxID=591372 RepID=A0A8J2YMM9_9RHOB|nr:PACE efflux transporter [Agaricicola taiwanensis]GGE53552.1 hypothetical protein GCM10007276_33210 [Agaricicola taiwanensis]